jgi:hypothetical protein
MTNSSTIFDRRDIVFYHKESMEKRLGFVSTPIAPEEAAAISEQSGMGPSNRISKF